MAPPATSLTSAAAALMSAGQIAVDVSGDAFVTGYTSGSFRRRPALIHRPPAAGLTRFVTKINPAGSTLTYSSVFGGTSDDTPDGIAVTSDGRATVVGTTGSSNYPINKPLSGSSYAGNPTVFVTQLTAAGDHTTYSTYVGAGDGNRIAGDLSNNM